MNTKVVVVDDHVLLSQAIGELVNGFDSFELAYLCNNGQELLDAMEQPNKVPDMVLIDINMPILNGIDKDFLGFACILCQIPPSPLHFHESPPRLSTRRSLMASQIAIPSALWSACAADSKDGCISLTK